MRNVRPVAVGLPPGLRRLLYVLGGLLAVAYVIHTGMYRVYTVNYRSNREIESLRLQLDQERARAKELEWEKRCLQGPEGPSLAALREGWGRPGQVRIRAKMLRSAERREQGGFRHLADRLRDWLRGDKRPPPPAP